MNIFNPTMGLLKELPGKALSCALGLLLVFCIACNGQYKTHAADSEVNEPAPAKNLETEAQIASSPHESWVDPLFFLEGQLCQHLRCIHQDSRGALLFGTNVYGLMRYDGDSLQYLSESDGVGKGRITEILEDKEGNVWIGTYGGLTKYDGKRFITYTEADGLPENEIWALELDRNGLLWIGTIAGVCTFDGVEFMDFDIQRAPILEPEYALYPERITQIMEDAQGKLWFGTDGHGLTVYDPDDEHPFSFITRSNGLPDNIIYDLMQDSKGNVWIGTMFGGLSLFDGDGYTNFIQDSLIVGIEIGGLYEDGKGNIWFASEGHGVYRYNGRMFANFQEREGLASRGILCMYEDREGRFWAGGWGGLFRYDGSGELRLNSKTGLRTDSKPFYSISKHIPWD